MTQIHHKTLHNPIAVAGFQIRTTNAAELSGSGKIEQLWHRFFVENLAAQIPNRSSEDLYAVYSNYESDETAHTTTCSARPSPPSTTCQQA